MKALALALVVVSGCSKKPAAEAGPGSGSVGPPGSASASSTGSAAAGSATPGATSGAAATPGAPSSPGSAERSAAALALEDFDRVYAPITKLTGAARIRAVCTNAKLLSQKAHALPDAPSASAAAAWDEAERQLAQRVDELEHICLQISRAAFGKDDELATHDGDFPDSDGHLLHNAYARLVALVPDAAPVGTHADDPLPAADPSGTPGNPDGAVKLERMRAALRALDTEVTKLAAGTKNAKSRAGACKGAPKLQQLYQALRTSILADSPPTANDWAGHVANLGMQIDDMVENKCGADSHAGVEDLQSRYDVLHGHLGEMLKMCGRQ